MPNDGTPEVVPVKVGIVSMNFSNKRVAGVAMDDEASFRSGDQLQFGEGDEARTITVTTIEQHKVGVTEARINSAGRLFGVKTGFRDNQPGQPVFRLDSKPPAGSDKSESREPAACN